MALVSQEQSTSVKQNATTLHGARLSFIGCGVMAEAIIAGLLKEALVVPEQIVGSHPRAERREELTSKYGIQMLQSNLDAATLEDQATPYTAADAATASSMVVLAVKPQRLSGILSELKGKLKPHQVVLSVVAGARIETIASELLHPAVVRAMPNTPAQVGHGMTVWIATPEVTAERRQEVRHMLRALGQELEVHEERQIDMATALSATGPTYIFMMMEALTDAGVHLGFSRHVAQQLVLQTMLGSVLFAQESHKHPAELRNMVTSPGGTSAEAIYQMEKGSLRTVLSKAVYAAYQRAVALGGKEKGHS